MSQGFRRALEVFLLLAGLRLLGRLGGVVGRCAGGRFAGLLGLGRLGGELLHGGGRAFALGPHVAEPGAAQDAARAAGGGRDAGGGEIVGDAALLLGAGGVDQPHQQEEGHHRGDEVGIGHLPRTTVVAAADHLLDLLDDDRRVVAVSHRSIPPVRGLLRGDSVKMRLHAPLAALTQPGLLVSEASP